MKKTSKVLSFIIGSVMAVCTIGSLSADAWSFISPEGSVLDELDTEKGIVVYRIVDGTSGDDWYDKSGCCYQRYSNFAYNCLEVKLNDSISVDLKEEALEALRGIGMDGFYNEPYFRASDNYVAGNDPTTQSVPDRYDKVKAVIDKLYKEGAIEEADITPFFYALDGQYLTDHISVKNSSLPIEEYQNLVSTYSEKAVAKESEGNNGDDRIITILLNLDESDYTYNNIFAIRDEIEGLCDGSHASVFLRREENIPGKNEQTINLLDPYICDIDASGKADPSDATTILSAYAENAAGLRTAVDEKMDVNGDGEVSVDDATYVLSYYAQAAAGLR